MPSDSERLLLATRSHDKVSEIRAILPARLRERILSLDDVALEYDSREDHIETYETFQDNALAKAEHFNRLTGLVTIADDSGLVVNALNGQPGVRSKRFSGREDVTGIELDRSNNLALLEAMKDVTGAERRAHYVCAAVAIGRGAPLVAFGTVAGRILEQPSGNGGFGYDPLFHHTATGRCFGEIEPALKHALSHRGRAFRALATLL